MILFDYPEEKSFPFNIYIPPDLLEQVKEQHHRGLKAELHRRTFDKLIKKLGQKNIAGNLCALVVKMDAWNKLAGKGSLTNSVQFLMSDMIRGIEKMPELNSLEDPSFDDEAEFAWIN